MLQRNVFEDSSQLNRCSHSLAVMFVIVAHLCTHFVEFQYSISSKLEPQNAAQDGKNTSLDCKQNPLMDIFLKITTSTIMLNCPYLSIVLPKCALFLSLTMFLFVTYTVSQHVT